MDFSNSSTIVSLGCVFDGETGVPRSIKTLMLRFAFPFLALLVFVVILYSVYFLLQRRRQKEKRSLEVYGQRMVTILLVIFFFAHPNITEDLMRIFQYIELDDDESLLKDPYAEFAITRGRYWGMDTSLHFLKGHHAKLAYGIGIPGLVIFSLGIPALLFGCLSRHYLRNGKKFEKTIVKTYGFLFQNYRDEVSYWEGIITLRKVSISAVAVFAYSLGADLQAAVAVAVLFIAFVLHVWSRPFRYEILNAFEAASLVVSIFTFHAGIVFNDANTSEGGRFAMSFLVFGMNVALMGAFFFFILRFSWKYITLKFGAPCEIIYKGLCGDQSAAKQAEDKQQHRQDAVHTQWMWSNSSYEPPKCLGERHRKEAIQETELSGSHTGIDASPSTRSCLDTSDTVSRGGSPQEV